MQRAKEQEHSEDQRQPLAEQSRRLSAMMWSGCRRNVLNATTDKTVAPAAVHWRQQDCQGRRHQQHTRCICLGLPAGRWRHGQPAAGRRGQQAAGGIVSLSHCWIRQHLRTCSLLKSSWTSCVALWRGGELADFGGSGAKWRRHTKSGNT